MRKQLLSHFIMHPETFTVRQMLLSLLRTWAGLGWMKKKLKRETKEMFFHPTLKQPLDLHVEVLMGVRCAPNQRNMAGNVSEPQQRIVGL